MGDPITGSPRLAKPNIHKQTLPATIGGFECFYNIHDMNICRPTCLHAAQGHVAPIMAHVSVKVKECCTKDLLRQSFQLKKSHNKSVLLG